MTTSRVIGLTDNIFIDKNKNVHSKIAFIIVGYIRFECLLDIYILECYDGLTVDSNRTQGFKNTMVAFVSYVY